MQLLAIVLALLVTPMQLQAQTTRVEVDHVFVMVQAFSQVEAAALQQLGFTIDTVVTRHEGQGTASRSVILGNAYLELLWIDSTVSVSPESAQLLAELRRASSWRTTGASPFGLGLRRVAGPEEYGVPVQRYSATWMTPGSYVAVLKQPQEELSIGVFVVPDYMSLAAWIGLVEQQTPALLQHSNGSRRVTSVTFAGPASHHPSVAKLLLAEGLSFLTAEEPLLTLELDSGLRGVVHDLRPLIPLVIRR